MSIKVVGKVQAGEQWAVTGELRRRVLAAFADAGIGLPLRNLAVDRDRDDVRPDAVPPAAAGGRPDGLG